MGQGRGFGASGLSKQIIEDELRLVKPKPFVIVNGI